MLPMTHRACVPTPGTPWTVMAEREGDIKEDGQYLPFLLLFSSVFIHSLSVLATVSTSDRPKGEGMAEPVLWEGKGAQVCKALLTPNLPYRK